jgi:uncharacterized protein (TIGR03437 family)
LSLSLSTGLLQHSPGPKVTPSPKTLDTPKGLAASDWNSIRAVHDKNRYKAIAGQDGLLARNWSQQWSIHFDGRGFAVEPDQGGWRWGLELKSYGRLGNEQAVFGRAEISSDLDKIHYKRGVLDEWFVNDQRGLEQGFTLSQRPDGGGGPLWFNLALRGGLAARIHSDGLGASFASSSGQTLLTYAGLKAWDADGRLLRARFSSADSGELSFEVDESGARYPITIDPITQQAYLKSSNPDINDRFGTSLAISGDTIVVGAPFEASNATGVNGDQSNNSAGAAGAAYVFVRNGGVWTQQAYLKASNTDVGDQFGTSVAISSDTIVVGAPNESSNATGVNGNQSNNSASAAGAAYVFTRTGNTWSQQAYLKASNTDASDEFGGAVAVSGDSIVVGAESEASSATGVNGNQFNNSVIDRGAAYVFTRTGTVWSQQAYLKPSNAGPVFFGYSTAISGNTIIVGAVHEKSAATGINGNQFDTSAEDAGAAYVFVRNGTVWTQQAYLKASNTDAHDNFGQSVALDVDTIVVGAYSEASSATGVNGDQTDNSAPYSGAGYVFVRNGTTWSQQAYLKASNTDSNDNFGASVSVSGDTIVVGANYESSASTGVNGNQADNSLFAAGAAYVFSRSGTIWTQLAYLKASNTDQGDVFGSSVSVSGTTIVVSAPRESSASPGVNGNQADNSFNGSGASYVFSLGLDITTASPLPYASQGFNYSTNLTATGGTSYTWGITSGSLPPLLNLNPNTGQITGVPNVAGTFTFSVTATDVSLLFATKSFTLGIPQIASASPLPPGAANVAYSSGPLQYTDGPAGMQWSVVQGSLPPTFVIDAPTGNIHGTTSVAGVYNFVVAVTGGGAVASKSFSLAINSVLSPLTITTSSLAPAAPGQFYQQTVSAAGGVPPYTFSGSGFPAGVGISPTGLISGTIGAPGSFSVSVTVTDSQPAQVTKVFTLVVASPITISAVSLPNGSVGHSYFQTLSATGGNGTGVTFSASGLPAGLGITASGTISGTPSVAGTFAVTVTATDGVSSASVQLTLRIDGLPTLTTGSPLAPATVGVQYSTQFTASGGATPYSFFFLSGPSSAPPGLALATDGTLSGIPTAAGAFAFAVQVIDANRNSASASFDLTILPGTQPLNVSPGALQFTAATGGDNPGTQTVGITASGGAAIPFTLQIDNGNGDAAPDYLLVSPASGTTPATVRVTAVPGSHGTGSLAGRLKVGLNGGGTLVNVPVALALTAPAPKLSVVPSLLRFIGHTANPGLAQLTFAVQNSGGGGPVAVAVSTANGSSWIKSLTPSAGAIQANLPVLVAVNIDTTGLKVGSYSDSIHVATGIGSLDVPVSLFVAGPGPFLSDSIDGVRFATRVGNTTSRTQQVSVRNLGDPGSSLNWSAQVIRGADLVVLTNSSGVSTPSSPTSFNVQLSATAAGSPGGKFALIQVNAPLAENSPEYFIVVADVADATADAVPDPDPAGLAFVLTAGAGKSAPKQVTVNTTSATAVPFSVSTSTDDGAKWLTATSSSAVTSLTNPAQVSVSSSGANLGPGIYTGLVNFAIAKVVRSVNVLLVVKTVGTVAPLEAPSISGRAATCTPAKLAIVENGLANNFSVPAGWPEAISVQVLDDCGSSVTNASVAASFSNGDPPIPLIGDGQTSVYSATWQPGFPSAQMTVTVAATAGALAPARTQLGGNVDPNANPAPSLVLAGLLNNLNPYVGGALAPGTVTQVYGDNLASAADSPTSTPLPTFYKGVGALIGGMEAPIYYISKTQLTVQVPVELEPNHTYPVVLVSGAQFTEPQNVDLIPYAPAVFARPDGTLVAQHAADFSSVDSTHPAKPNENLVVYLVGMGATAPAVPSGALSPSGPLASLTAKVQVTIDNQPADVTFAGLSPGGIGLYQINLRLPGGLRSGTLDVVILEDNVKANPAKLVVGN